MPIFPCLDLQSFLRKTSRGATWRWGRQ